tara:strand:- start:218 stop:523 length:306 start_codon:yes stop_codon:yes gene_type:complete
VRLAEQLKILLSDFFLKKGVYINSSPSMITITKVDLSDDLKHAKVFFTSITDDDKKTELENLLNQASKSYKYVIGKKIRTKSIPNFRFIYDQMFAVDFTIK